MGFLSQFDAFHEMASKATGLADFGSDDYREPMRLLLDDFDESEDDPQPASSPTAKRPAANRVETRFMTSLQGFRR